MKFLRDALLCAALVAPAAASAQAINNPPPSSLLSTAQTWSATQTFGTAKVQALQSNISTISFFQAAAPTCSAVGGSPTCTMTGNTGSAGQWMTLGAASSATAMSITGLTAASHAYVCPILIDTTTPTIWGIQTGFSTTGATWTFYTKGTATAASPGASDVVETSCAGV